MIGNVKAGQLGNVTVRMIIFNQKRNRQKKWVSKQNLASSRNPQKPMYLLGKGLPSSTKTFLFID